eukprot:EG_transcript_24252
MGDAVVPDPDLDLGGLWPEEAEEGGGGAGRGTAGWPTADAGDDGGRESDALTASVVVFESPRLAQPLRILERRARGIGFQLWPAATTLCRFLETCWDSLEVALAKPMAEAHCVELGAGVGLVGMFAAALGAGHVTLTDLPPVLAVLRENVALNAAGWAGRQPPAAVDVQPLCWGTEDPLAVPATDLVLVADCVYWEELFAPLLATLRHFVDRGAVVLMAHVRRWTRDNRFFRQAARLMQLQMVH